MQLQIIYLKSRKGVMNMEETDIKFLSEVVHFKKAVLAALKVEIPTNQRKIKMAYDRINKAISRYCNDKGVEIKDIEGMEYDPGLPVDPLNLEDFTPNDELYVGVMLEPIIKEKGTSKVLRNGKVFLVAK